MAGPNRARKPRSRIEQPSSRPLAARRPAIGVWWRVTAIVIGGSLTYLNTLSNPFLLDDVSSIVENEDIRHLGDLWHVLLPERERPVSGRPVVNLSFAINYAISGLNVAGYHILNIAVHLLCGVLIFAIVRRAMELPERRATPSTRSTNLAFAAALIWVLHPLNSEVVDYLTQRTESMMACFFLLTLFASLRALSGPTAKWEALAVLSCALGMGCKETMVTAPVAIILFDRIFVFDSFKKAFHERRRLYIGLAATWLILAALLSTGARRNSAGFSVDVSPWTYLLNQAPMLTRYIRLAFWPNSLVAFYGWPIPVTLTDVMPYAVLILLLLALTSVALRFQPKLGFLGAWFFITLAPTSSIVPIATEAGAERRMYLALAALIVLVLVALAWVWDRLEHKLPNTLLSPKRGWLAATLLLAGVSTALAAGTVARNREYQSALSLERTILERYPTPFAQHLLATELLEVGNRQEAMPLLRQAVAGAPRAHLTLGIELLKDGKLEEAIAELQAFIRKQPHLVWVIQAREYLGRAFARQQRWPEAVGEFREILRISPSYPAAEHLLADTFFSQQAFDEAIVHYRAYLALQPNDIDALNQLAIAQGSTGKLADAIVTLRRAVELDPANGAARRNLATALWAKGDADEAAVHARRAVALQPDDAGSHDVLGRALQQQGRLDDAAKEFERSLQLDPTFADAREDLQRLRQLRRSR